MIFRRTLVKGSGHRPPVATLAEASIPCQMSAQAGIWRGFAD
jgi:hypothetical protein